jgi:tetratricopeptide (TPR) repeat protein
MLLERLPGQILDNPGPNPGAHLFEMGADIPPIQGEIRNLHGNVTDLGVVVFDVSGGRKVEQTEITPDGMFRLANIRPGTYLLKVVDSRRESILEEIIHVGSAAEPLTLQLPESSSQPTARATVSSDRLQHPLSAKGVKVIRKAQDCAASGDHLKAIEELKQALKEPSAVPYAHALLGQEYLKIGQVRDAGEELEQATALLPHDAIVHSNLGYALFLMGDSARGEQEVRRALELDHNNSPAQRLLGYILKARQANPNASGNAFR